MSGPLNLHAIRMVHRRFAVELDAEIGGALQDAETVGLASVRTNPGFKPRTGALQDATESRIVRTKNRKLLRFWNKKPYAAAIDKGAHPHFIFARKKPYLRFRTKGGQWVSRRAVKHPGNRAYKFLSNATDKAFSTLGRGLERETRHAVQRFNTSRA